MFAKPYKLKSNNTLKNTEKKNLIQRIQNEFPSSSIEKLKELVPIKSVVTCMKVMIASGELVLIYVVDGVPVMVEQESGLVPTVCALWKVPEMVPHITIHSPVLPKVVGGAPLYVPGVVCVAGALPLFPARAVLAARTADNAAAAVVGRALMSSGDMLMKSTGVCMETLQVFGDQLCKDVKLSRFERPQFGSGSHSAVNTANVTRDLAALSIDSARSVEEWPALGPAPRASSPAPRPAPALIPDTRQAGDVPREEGDVEEETEGSEEADDSAVPSNMDELLQWSLLTFLKLEAKHVTLPLMTNLLYKNHLIPLVSKDRNLDVKKSSYKKMSKFLEAMQQEGLVEVRETERGVWSITGVNLSHPRVRGHTVPTRVRDHAAAARAPPAPATDYRPPAVREMYCATAAVHNIMPTIKKGKALTSAEVRALLTEYVTSHGLHSAQVRGAVQADAHIATVIGKKPQDVVKWDVLMTSVLARMTAATEMRFEDGEVRLVKSKLEPIKMQVANRSGNKKVTLVSNLESFGFELISLSHASQLAVGAACTVTRSPGAKADQLMLQGDQTYFVAKLLIEKYGLPKKFLEGADKALNKKK